jgi:sodium-dependent phosphate cotransporter
MANSFRILGGKTSGRAFRNSEFFDNPLAGLVTGILTTVLVQSSSTSTSIIITMTAGDLIKVKNAIPMIMGANIGTSVTNTIVSLGSFGDKNEYRRAFAGATIHDCFNFLTVMMFLPIEAITGVLAKMAEAICDSMDVTDSEEKGAKTDFLKKLTGPTSKMVLSIDKKLITTIAKSSDADVAKYDDVSIIKNKQKDSNHIFMDTPMSDGVAGILMVTVSLFFLSVCLMVLVKLLQTIFRGRIAIWFRNALNLEFSWAPGLANYVLIVFGMGITILFQSSSVTTSTLTPLVGVGLVRLDKMFAFTIGANVGTTITGILSALVSDKRKTGLTVAFSHTLFNLLGTLIWYPIPLLRNVPISMSKVLGNIAADLKWFPIVYILCVFGGIPVFLLGLSLASPWLTVFVGIPFLLFLAITFAIVSLRTHKPHLLPGALKKDFAWMPPSLRVEKVPEEETAGTTASSADLGAENWQAAPAAWGMGWFIVLALVVVCFNAKWADMKYVDWDGRNHYGISFNQVCSKAFEADMAWAPVLNEAACPATTFYSCGGGDVTHPTLLAKSCKKSDFSTTEGSYKAYQSSWSKCRAVCSAKQWESWCIGLNCGGSDHKLQCQNVTGAVHRGYDIAHGPKGTMAWTKGELCRPLSDMCTKVDGSVKAAGALGVVGFVMALTAQLLLVTNSMRPAWMKTLMASLAFFALAWIFLLASWAAFAGSIGQDAECIVEAETTGKKGVVKAIGKFGDIINGGGSYTFAFVIASWCLLPVPMALIALRIRDVQKGPKTAYSAENKADESNAAPVEI